MRGALVFGGLVVGTLRSFLYHVGEKRMSRMGLKWNFP